MSGHFDVTVRDESGAVLDVFAVANRADNLRLALESAANQLRTRDAGHGTEAASLSIERYTGSYIVRSIHDKHGISFGPFTSVAAAKAFIRNIGASVTVDGPYSIIRAGDEYEPNPRIFNYTGGE